MTPSCSRHGQRFVGAAALPPLLLESSALDTETGGGSLPLGLVVGLAAVTAVFVFGPNAVRKQRASGKTSKFPRIG